MLCIAIIEGMQLLRSHSGGGGGWGEMIHENAKLYEQEEGRVWSVRTQLFISNLLAIFR